MTIRRRPALFASFVLLALLEFSLLHLLRPLDLRLMDRQLAWHAQDRVPDPEVILVAIDEHSLDALADDFGRFPWSRSAHAEVADYLLRQGARAVVFDLLFSDPDLERPHGDAHLIEVANGTPPIYFPLMVLDSPSQGLPLDSLGPTLGFHRTATAAAQAHAALVLPLRPLALTGHIGSINFLADEDGVGRRYPLYQEVAGWRIPSLPARLALDFGWPLPDGDSVIIHWRGQANDRQRHSFADLHADAGRRQARLPAADFRDRIAIIGATAAGLHDLRQSPLSPLHPGSDMLAAAIETLKAGDGLRRLAPAWPALLCLLLLGLLFGAALRGTGPLQMAAGLLLASGGALAAGQAALNWRWLMPLASPLLLAWLFFVVLAVEGYLSERRRRAHAVGLFGRFVDPRVVGQLVDDESAARSLGGARRRITLLFSDIRGFTTLSESHSPEQIVDLLNRYFSRQVDVIFRHGGTVDKFIGDAIMAFWGAPLPDEQQASHAIAAALEMSAVVDAMRSELGELGADFDIGIGLHTGDAVVGFIGADHRLDYTAIGDAVNLASRIEGLTKGVARVLVSEETRAASGEAFDFIERGRYKVKGRQAEVLLFEPRSRGL